MAAPTSDPHQRPGLPSITSLTNGLPPTSKRASDAEPIRDSGTWPQPPPYSKHTSASSGLHVSTLLNPDDSPQRSSIPNTPLSARPHHQSRTSAGTLPSINQGFHPDHSNRESRGSYRDSYHPSLESRRSSVDSRVHQSMHSLYIHNPTSPHESTTASQVSLAANLRRSNGSVQHPHSPVDGCPSSRIHAPPRVAPPIMPVARAPGQPKPTAAEPTQGYAWAFPDSAIPEARRVSDSDDGSSVHGGSRSSFAASSLRSSVFSGEMPPGQRRFHDDRPPTAHHHVMQHRTISTLQHEHAVPPVGNYSRTPELRVSHKLAERKRRSEMKDLFEELNKAVPSHGGSKASKWEILTKAIDYIRSTQHQERHLHGEVQRLQRDAEYAREAHKENELLKTEVQVMHQALRRADPHAPHVYGQFTSHLTQHGPPNVTTSVSLPPLNTSVGTAASYGAAAPPPPAPPGPAPAPMQGVEYGYAAR